MRYRHEYKFYLNEGDYILLKHRLDVVMKKDIHAINGRYRIKSLYFDDINDKALNEKLDGLSRRSKYRIRIYNDDLDFIKLEKKEKISGLGTKYVAPVNADEVRQIIDGSIEWMASDDRELVKELYQKLRYEGLKPKTIVTYDREPYIYEAGNVRVTFDTNVRTSNYAIDLLNPSLASVKASEKIIIMEVKYDDFLPDIIRDLLQLESRSLGAFSKYAAARSYTN